MIPQIVDEYIGFIRENFEHDAQIDEVDEWKFCFGMNLTDTFYCRKNAAGRFDSNFQHTCMAIQMNSSIKHAIDRVIMEIDDDEKLEKWFWRFKVTFSEAREKDLEEIYAEAYEDAADRFVEFEDELAGNALAFASDYIELFNAHSKQKILDFPREFFENYFPETRHACDYYYAHRFEDLHSKGSSESEYAESLEDFKSEIKEFFDAECYIWDLLNGFATRGILVRKFEGNARRGLLKAVYPKLLREILITREKMLERVKAELQAHGVEVNAGTIRWYQGIFDSIDQSKITVFTGAFYKQGNTYLINGRYWKPEVDSRIPEETMLENYRKDDSLDRMFEYITSEHFDTESEIEGNATRRNEKELSNDVALYSPASKSQAELTQISYSDSQEKSSSTLEERIATIIATITEEQIKAINATRRELIETQNIIAPAIEEITDSIVALEKENADLRAEIQSLKSAVAMLQNANAASTSDSPEFL